MIKRLLVVLFTAGGIVFVPFLIAPVNSLFYDTDYNDFSLGDKWSLGFGYTILAILLLVLFYFAIKYIIKGD